MWEEGRVCIGSNHQETSLIVKDQGLPKWSPIVCQGSGRGHDVQPAGYDSNNLWL